VEVDADSVAGPLVTSDIAKFLVPGSNVIAVTLKDNGGCVWLVVDGTVK